MTGSIEQRMNVTMYQITSSQNFAKLHNLNFIISLY